MEDKQFILMAYLTRIEDDDLSSLEPLITPKCNAFVVLL
jgi:hypothetical protein